MKKTSLLFNSRFVFFGGPEGGADKPRELTPSYSKEQEKAFNNRLDTIDRIGTDATKVAGDKAIQKGEELTANNKKEIADKAKQDAAKWDSQSKEISESLRNSPVFVCKETMPIREFLDRPEPKAALGLRFEESSKGLFPELKGEIKKGQFLVIGNRGKALQILSVDDSKNTLSFSMNSVSMLARSARDEGKYNKMVASRTDDSKDKEDARQIYAEMEAETPKKLNFSDLELPYIVEKSNPMAIDDDAEPTNTNKEFQLKDGVVKFANETAEKKTTLGQMFGTEESLVVNGKLAIKSPNDGEFHLATTNKAGEVVLNKPRVLVFNGTTIKTEIPEQYASIVKKFEKKRTA